MRILFTYMNGRILPGQRYCNRARAILFRFHVSYSVLHQFLVEQIHVQRTEFVFDFLQTFFTRRNGSLVRFVFDVVNDLEMRGLRKKTG